LTLLECKTDPTDPALQRAAAYIRTHAPSSSENYDISTAILFLDRLGDPKDRPLIQNLAIRLLCSQNEDASWGYRANVPDADGAQKLLAFLQSHKQPNGKSVSDKGPIAANTLNEFLQSRVVVVNQGRAKGAHVVKGASLERSSDHSNTQFALLALWAARRHDVPTDHALLASWQRFMMIQNQDGGWAYTAPDVPGAIAAAFPTTNTMSCVGLLALALGHGISPDLQVNPKKPAERVVRPPTQDPRIELGLRSTARWVGQPLAAANVRSAKIDNLYFLWSVERVGVLYELEQINGKDWYAWGAQILVTNQTAGGDWPSVFYPGSEATANTCFALLFLKRSNLVQDLTETFRLQSGIRNP
jgi:hypothetical protein